MALVFGLKAASEHMTTSQQNSKPSIPGCNEYVSEAHEETRNEMPVF